MNYRAEIERIESRRCSWPLREEQTDEIKRYYRNQPRRVKEISDINWEDEGEHSMVLNGMICEEEPWAPVERALVGSRDLEKSREEFLDGLRKRTRITDAARQSIESVLDNLMATSDVSFSEMEQQKAEAYYGVLSVVDRYCGRYSKVPCLYIANKLRDWADNLPRSSYVLKEIVLQVADAVESVRGKRANN